MNYNVYALPVLLSSDFSEMENASDKNSDKRMDKKSFSFTQMAIIIMILVFFLYVFYELLRRYNNDE
jgi:hypothetical protein